MHFPVGGTYLPHDYVDEGKLLLFMEAEVITRSPKRGARLTADKKRNANAAAKKAANTKGKAIEHEETPTNNDDEEEEELPLVLLCNTVRGYFSAINELWAHQTSRGLHTASRPQGVAMKALKTSLVRGQYQQKQSEFAGRGVGALRDGYLPSQIPDLTRVVWSRDLGGDKCIEQSFRTLVDFTFAN